MREPRHGHVRPLSPPRPRSRGSDRDVKASWRFSNSYRSPGPVLSERDRSRPLDSPSWREQRYGYVRTRSPSKPRNLDGEEIGGHRRFSGSSQSSDMDRHESAQFNETGSVQRRGQEDRQYTNEARGGHLKNLSQFCESLSRRESTFMKFQWDNLLADHNKLTSANANTKSNDMDSSHFDGYCNTDPSKASGVPDLGVVPTSMSTDNGGSRTLFGYCMEPTTRSRNHGLKFDAANVSHVRSMRVRKERTSIVDPIVEMIEEHDAGLRDSVKEGKIFDKHGCFGEAYLDVRRRESHLVGMDAENEENLDCRGNQVDHWVEVCWDPEKLKLVEDFGFERDGGSGSCGDGLKISPISYEGLHVTENSPQEFAMAEEPFKRSPISCEGLYMTESSPQTFAMAEEPGIHEPSELMLKRELSLDMETSRHNHKTMLSCDWKVFDGIHDDMKYGVEEWNNQDMEQFSLLANSGLRHSHSDRSGGMIDGMMGHGNANSHNPLSSPDLPLQKLKHSSKPVKPSKKSIKQRLGPVRNVKKRLGPAPNPSKKSIKQRLGPVQNVKKRLGPAPNARKGLQSPRRVQKKLPWVKRFKESCLEDSDGSPNVQGVKSSELNTDKKLCVKTEPPEDSDEFRQLVQRAFLRFTKFLNENSANRKKYMEQGRTGILNCGVCGSNSKEFEDTLSLAQHAFMSRKVGSKSEHLGLHKALCVLMGWNSAVFSNSAWVRRTLPDAEASSLKEDLIIWPPVVVIHNSSIANDNPDERMIVSVEKLRDILRGMGFGQGMTNLCCGKAANQSTIVVSFNGTFSGLREAERLHRLYADNRHGRAEFQQISFSGPNSGSGQTRRFLAKKAENVLYGYLGIAGDLDKLDFEIKKWCVVKSKKEINAIADASLNNE